MGICRQVILFQPNSGLRTLRYAGLEWYNAPLPVWPEESGSSGLLPVNIMTVIRKLLHLLCKLALCRVFYPALHSFCSAFLRQRCSASPVDLVYTVYYIVMLYSGYILADCTDCILLSIAYTATATCSICKNRQQNTIIAFRRKTRDRSRRTRNNKAF